MYMVNNFLLRLFASQCCICGGDSAESICSPCASELPWTDTACTQCGLSLSAPGLCGQCLIEPPPFTRCISAFEYRAPVSHLIGAFKYQRRLVYGRALSALLAARLHTEPELAADIIVPVPLHWRRRWTRGFNQAEVIADELAHRLRIPLHAKALLRLKQHTPQQQLTAVQRRRNLRSGFAIRGDVRGRHVALVDDVVTTGATAAEIARTLLDAGAAAVQVWCLARTP